jgi:hypothetical protein
MRQTYVDVDNDNIRGTRHTTQGQEGLVLRCKVGQLQVGEGDCVVDESAVEGDAHDGYKYTIGLIKICSDMENGYIHSLAAEAVSLSTELYSTTLTPFDIITENTGVVREAARMDAVMTALVREALVVKTSKEKPA